MSAFSGVKMRVLIHGLVLVAALFVISPIAHGQARLVEGDNFSLDLGGNLQMVSAYIDLPTLEIPEELQQAGIAPFPDSAGLGSVVGRIEWQAYLGDRVSVEIHNRFLWQASTVPDDVLQQGFGVTPQGGSRFQTETKFLSQDNTRLSHDLDRFVVALFFEKVDLYIGRQAIQWGVSSLFPVADRFAPFSPFELDTLQRRGVDAIRGLANLGSNWELDLVVADRGRGEPLALAARAEYFASFGDVYLGVGRFWERASLLGGVSWLQGNWKVYGEGEGLFHLDHREVELPRVTLGAQRVAMDWQIGAEFHLNGLGAANPQGYTDLLGSAPFQRGETYFLGRYYGGLSGFYGSETGWGIGGALLANLGDPSLVIAPSFQYELEEQMTVSAGVYLGFGSPLEADLTGIQLQSEYGSFADMYFLQMTAFF